MEMNLKPLDPFNITILNPDEYIQRKGCLPVTSFSIFEASSTRFHPDGLFSEVIFGQIGSRERLIKRGYYDLRTKIITPHLYKQVISLKSFYKNILASKDYAKIDPETGDLMLTTPDDPEGRTGFIWFCEVLPKLKFTSSTSIKRKIKVDLVNKYMDNILIDKFIILPAGVRDMRVDDRGKTSPEEINKLYTSLFSVIQALPEDGSTDPIYDSIRLQIQNKALEIYEYIAGLIEGKHGFAQGKLVARNVSYSSRNVITAAPMTKVASTNSPQAFDVNEIMLPLFQAMKSSMPVMINKLKSYFFDQIFASQSMTIPAVDPDTKEIVYIDVDNDEYNKFTTTEGINKMMSDFRNPHNHKLPVSIVGKVEGGKPKPYWLYLVYDDDTSDIFYFRSKSDFVSYINLKQTINPDQQLLIDLDDIPLDADDYLIAGSAGAALLFGGRIPVYRDIVFLARNEEVAKQLYGYLDTCPDKFLNPSVEVMTTNELNYLDSTQPHNDTITVGQHKVLSHDQLLNWYNRRPAKAKDKELRGTLKQYTCDTDKIRPLTQMEMFYVACYAALQGRYTTATRHPVLVLSNITLNRIKLMSTTISRVVKFRTLSPDSPYLPLPHYPVMSSDVKGSMSVHPSHLEKYDGKHDCRRVA